MNISSLFGVVMSALHFQVSTGAVVPAATTKETVRGFLAQMLEAAEPMIEGATLAVPGGSILAEIEHVAIQSIASGLQGNTAVAAQAGIDVTGSASAAGATATVAATAGTAQGSASKTAGS